MELLKRIGKIATLPFWILNKIAAAIKDNYLYTIVAFIFAVISLIKSTGIVNNIQNAHGDTKEVVIILSIALGIFMLIIYYAVYLLLTAIPIMLIYVATYPFAWIYNQCKISISKKKTNYIKTNLKDNIIMCKLKAILNMLNAFFYMLVIETNKMHKFKHAKYSKCLYGYSGLIFIFNEKRYNEMPMRKYIEWGTLHSETKCYPYY